MKITIYLPKLHKNYINRELIEFSIVFTKISYEISKNTINTMLKYKYMFRKIHPFSVTTRYF